MIKFFRDGIQFWNPGDVFGDDSRLFEPGEKEVRNPAITMAMREQAGTGMRMMREEWQKMGHPIPTYNNDRAWKAFEFFISELDKEVDMASDLMKAMFGRPDQVTGEVTGEVQRLLTVMQGEMKRQEIQDALGLKHEDHFREKYLKPAMEAAAIEMTIPDKPRSSKQKYRLTRKGQELMQNSNPKLK